MKLKNINGFINHIPGVPMTALSKSVDERIEQHLPQVKFENLDPKARIHTAYRVTFPEGTTYSFVPPQYAGHRPNHAYTLPTGERLLLDNYWLNEPRVWWSNWDKCEPFKSDPRA